MTNDYWRSPGCYVPKDPKEQEPYLKELVFAVMINNAPHPASKKASERVNNERIGQLNHKAAFNPPLPQHMQEQRIEQERQAWRNYWSTHRKEHDHYRGDSPRHRHGGIWTGD
ncbi:hypothetical protein ACNFJN_04470 [Xenorhabdus budapestensis]|uniref:Uncharacterized protein n=1 Tax=Xenorhabdus budapestensis TaxID=290110 RepID=A0ABX7VPT9_XENBU|nr:hypothetical protein [Xenorhabdus budapestensis]QTL40564.1 hypothetical protein HGO23_04015 [Xenorhabdus budapestensis]